MAKTADLTTLLERLLATDVEFVLVGGLAAVVHGAPLTTFDVDIVHRRTEENVDRLMGFLASVGAYYRNRPGPPLPPKRSALLGPGHSLFMTDLGLEAARRAGMSRVDVRTLPELTSAVG